MTQMTDRTCLTTIEGVRLSLLALDVDGTLLDSQHRESPQLTALLEALSTCGAAIVLASSRPPQAITPLVHWADARSVPLIAFQGALTLSLRAGRVSTLSEESIPLRIARKIVQVGSATGATINWYAGTRWLVSEDHPLVAAEARIVGLVPEVTNLAEFPDVPHKLLALTGSSEVSDVLLSRLSTLEVNVEVSKAGYIEITARGVSKGRAVRRLMDEMGIPPAETVAIGDGYNDLSMFKEAGTSIAMANAPMAVRELATRTTGSNDDNGVLVAIRELLPRLPKFHSSGNAHTTPQDDG